MPESPKPTPPLMLKLLRPGIAWPPGMPTDALASPMPAQSCGTVANFTFVKPNKNSLSDFAFSVRVQLSARPVNGESLVPVSWLSSARRSGSDL